MNKILAIFLDRLTERLTVLLAGVLSSRVEGIRAAAQAEEQSRLEDLARSYESAGKPEVAETLRARARQVTSSDLAADAVQLVQQTSQLPELPAPDPPHDPPHALPDLSVPKSSRRRRRKQKTETAQLDSEEPLL